MSLSRRARAWCFRVLAACFAIAAAFHAAALVAPSIAEPSPPWRHALFVVTNAVVAVGMVRRPRGFVVAFALLSAQQLLSHGMYAFALFHAERRVDWASVVVLLAMPAILAFLAVDGRAPQSTANAPNVQ